jgi:hypothetical protein
MSRVKLLSDVDTSSNSGNFKKSAFFDLKIGEEAVVRIIGGPHVFVEYNSKFDELGPFPDYSETNKSTVRYGVKGVEDEYSKAGYIPRVKVAFNLLVKGEDGTNTHAIWNTSSTVVDKLKAIEDALKEESDDDEYVAIGSSKARWIKIVVKGSKPDKKGKINREWSTILLPVKKSPAITEADIAMLKEAGAPSEADLKAWMEEDDEPAWYFYGAALDKIFGPRKAKDGEVSTANDKEMSADELSLGDAEDEEKAKAEKAKALKAEKAEKARKAAALAAAAAAEAEEDSTEESTGDDFPDLSNWDK